ncbi:hypothetical protein RUM43_011934 [Polyplax serrata]|uniref:Isochorismatase domain-containing protein 1 n=1 Tax=Polyplax serrata TaxID=468196 RepID=A0AAN8PJZ3_POLSC
MANKLCKFGFLPARQSVFLLCDLQEKFRPALTYFEEIVQSAAKLASEPTDLQDLEMTFLYCLREKCVKVSEVMGIPLIVTEQNPKSLGPTVNDIKKDHAKGVFAKTKFSMCTPEVIDELKKIPDLKCAVLFGIETHACIEQTAIDLLGQDLHVHVVADACTSRSLEDRQLAFERMKQMGCFISTTENVIFKLLLDARNPKFGEIRSLVKDVTPYTGLCRLQSSGKFGQNKL